jgi:hypothetical protein
MCAPEQDAYEYDYTEDTVAGQIGMRAMGAISHNNLSIDFFGTECIDTSTGVLCETSMKRTTSIAGTRHSIIDYLDNNMSYSILEESVDEITALYRTSDEAYRVQFLIGFKEIKIFVTQKEWSS